jgi:hypothetical protein
LDPWNVTLRLETQHFPTLFTHFPIKQTDQSEKFVVADPSAEQRDVEIPTNNKLSGQQEGN